MKTKEFKEWRKKSLAEIIKGINDERKKLAEFSLALVGGKVKNIRDIRNTRKSIAQLLTIKQGLEKNEKNR